MLTSPERRDVLGSTLSSYANHAVHFVYNPTIGSRDLYRYELCLNHHYMTDASRELHRVWREGFSYMSADGTIFHWCHSEGVTHTRNALLSFPPELRNRIVIVAVCPSCYIDKELCKKVIHLCVEGDFVHKLDGIGREMAKRQGTVRELKSENPSIFNFLNNHDAFAKPLKKPVQDYLDLYMSEGR